MKLRTGHSIAILMATLATLSCTNAPVQQVVSHKDDYQQAYVYGFPMIAAYKALYQFNVDKTNSQYKGPFNQVLSVPRYLQCAGLNRHEVEDERALRERNSDPLGLESCAGYREVHSEA